MLGTLESISRLADVWNGLLSALRPGWTRTLRVPCSATEFHLFYNTQITFLFIM